MQEGVSLSISPDWKKGNETRKVDTYVKRLSRPLWFCWVSGSWQQMKVCGILRFTAFCWSLAGCLEVACLQMPTHRSSIVLDHFSQAACLPFLFAVICINSWGLMGQSLLHKEGSVLFQLSVSPINPHTQAGKRHVETWHYMNSQADAQTFPHRAWFKNN